MVASALGLQLLPLSPDDCSTEDVGPMVVAGEYRVGVLSPQLTDVYAMGEGGGHGHLGGRLGDQGA